MDDGSSDATALICQELKAQYPEIVVICHGQNRGYGAALKSGIMSAKHDLIFFSHSDGQFDFRDLEQLICWPEDYDIVAGYGAKRQDPLYRRINALGWNVLVRLMLGVKVRDIERAFKLFRRKVFDHVQIRCVGAMVNTEIFAQARQLYMRIREVKVTHLPRRHGKQSAANVHVILKALVNFVGFGGNFGMPPLTSQGFIRPMTKRRPFQFWQTVRPSVPRSRLL